MAEKEVRAEVFLVEEVCDACGEGVMRPVGPMQMTCPPTFPHQCTNCDNQWTFEVKYPYQRVRPVSDG